MIVGIDHQIPWVLGGWNYPMWIRRLIVNASKPSICEHVSLEKLPVFQRLPYLKKSLFDSQWFHKHIFGLFTSSTGEDGCPT